MQISKNIPLIRYKVEHRTLPCDTQSNTNNEPTMTDRKNRTKIHTRPITQTRHKRKHRGTR